MSYTMNKLSATKVRMVTRPGMHGDGAGLWLQVSKTGSKSWIFRYDFFGRRREMGLGSCNTVDLTLAREKARACRMVLLEKRDPLEERDKARAKYVQQQAKRVTFDECASAYIDGAVVPRAAVFHRSPRLLPAPAGWPRGAGSPLSTKCE